MRCKQRRGSPPGASWPPSPEQIGALERLDLSNIGIHRYWPFWLVLEGGSPLVGPISGALGQLARVTHNSGHNFVGGHNDREGIPVDESQNGFTVNIPIGLFFFLSDAVFFNANYTYNYLSRVQWIENEMASVFNLGVGFQFGD